MYHPVGENWIESRSKRVMDVAIGTAVAPLAFVVGGTAVVATMVTEQDNPIFVQKRAGQGFEPLLVPKIKTLEGTPDNFSSPNGYNHRRATKIGSILRKTHVDELPQGLLVLRGVMSIVGPRPLVFPEISETLDQLSPAEQREWSRARAFAKPGLLNEYSHQQHKQGSEFNLSIYERALMDIEYSQTASFKTDSRLILESLLYSKSDIFKLDIESPPGHPQTVNLILGIANSFGVKANADDEAYLRSVFNVAKAFDVLVDEQHVSNLDDEYQLLKMGKPITGLSEEEAAEFGVVYDSLSEERKLKLVKGLKLPKFAAEKAKAQTVTELLEVVKDEALIFGRLLSLDTHGNNRARLRFNKWLNGFSKAGYLMDLAIDLSADHKNGLVQVTPTASNEALVLKSATREMIACLGALPASALPLLFKATASKAIRMAVR